MNELKTISALEILDLAYLRLCEKWCVTNDYLNNNPNDFIIHHWNTIYESQLEELDDIILKLKKNIKRL